MFNLNYIFWKKKTRMVRLMKSELTNLMDLDVYTNKGRYVGKTDDVILNVEDKRASKIAVGNLNSMLREEFGGSRGIFIPYRWVLAVGDIIITKKLPRDIKPQSETREELKEEGKGEEEGSESKKSEKEKRKEKGLFEY